MSKTWLEDGPVGLGTYAGPADNSDRKRWQVTIMDGGDTASLDRDEAKTLLLTLAATLGWWCEPRE